MLKNYKLKIFTVLFAFSVSVGSVTALNSNLTLTTITNDSDSWVEVYNEKGIVVYFNAYQEKNQNFLDIKFENKTNQVISFSWILNKNGQKVLSESSYSINPNGSMGRADTSTLIPIKNNESLKDFSIIINQK